MIKKYLIVSIFTLCCALIVTSCAISSHEDYIIYFHESSSIKPYKKYYYLTASTIYVTINADLLIVPKDFITDLASIPRVGWSIMSPAYSPLIDASILHDYLYACPHGYTREEIDCIFYSSLLRAGLSKTTAYLMFLSVRIFGEKYFNKSGIVCFGERLNYVATVDNKQVSG